MNLQKAITFTTAFHDLGIKIAIDDFGSGFANIGFLKNFKCDIVKIDRAFVEDIKNSEFNKNILKHAIQLCHSIGMVVVIEGVEQEDEYLFVRDECGVDQIQGFYFGYPEMEDVFEKRLKK